jgi:zinc protease
MYLVSESLVGNKNSPLRKKLVDELKLATSVSGRSYGRVISGEYTLTIDLRPGVSPEEVRAMVDETIADYLREGPDAQIVENAKLGINMFVLGALETGSQIGRVLVEGELFSDDPLHINTELEWHNTATPEDLRQIASRWLTRGYYQLTVKPFPEYVSSDATVDRSSIPPVSTESAIQFPETESTVLDNGMKLVVARRGGVPLIDVSIQIQTGGMAAPADAPGLPAFVFGMLDKGTKRYDANELAAARDRIAMGGGANSSDEWSSFSYRILTSKLQPSLDLAAEMLRSPTFPDEEIEKVRARLLAYLANLELAPARAATGLFSRAIYGADNPKGAVWSRELVNQVDRAQLQAWHQAEIAPDNMTVFMIGDIDLATAQKAANDAFGRWKSKTQSARRAVGSGLDSGSRVILIDYPGAASSTIVAGRSIGAFDPETWTTLSIMNRAFGGGFESRLNTNLREDKGWSYGYRSSITRNASGDMVFRSSGQVQTDKTAASMQEIKRELDEFVSSRPATANEIDRIKLNRTRTLPGSFATNSGFLNSMVSSNNYGLPFNHAESSADRIATVTLNDVHAVAESIVDSGELTWLIVGDLEMVEEEVRALSYGDVEVWDAFGNRVR